MRAIGMAVAAVLLIGCSSGNAAADGVAGPPGPRGPQGVPGTQGPKGDPGTSNAGDLAAGSRLSVVEQAWTGEDGSRYAPPTWRFHDARLGVDCVPGTASDGVLRCVPADAVASISIFADASCATPAIVASAACAPPAYAYTWGDPIACGAPQPRTFYRVASNPIATIYTRTGSGCVGATAVGPQLWYATIGVIDPGTFVAFARR